MKRKGLIAVSIVLIMVVFSAIATGSFFDSRIIENNKVMAGVWDDIEGGAIGNQTIDAIDANNETNEENINNETHNIWDEANETIDQNETNIINNQTISNETVDFTENEIEKIDNETSEILINETIGGEK